MKNIFKKLVSILPGVASAVGVLVSLRISSEILTNSDFGRLMLLLGGIALIDAVFSASINQATFYVVHRGNLSFAIDSLILLIVKNKYKILTITGMFLAAYAYTAHLLQPSVHWAFLSALAMPIYISIESTRALVASWIHAKGRLGLNALALTADTATTLIISTLTLYYTHSLALYIGSITASKIVGFCLITHLVNKIDATDEQSTPRPTTFRAALRELAAGIDHNHIRALPLMGIVGWITGFIDRYAVALTAGPIVAGHYAAAIGIVSRPYNIVSTGLTNHFRPPIYKEFASNGLRRWVSVYQWLSICMACAIAGALLGLNFGEQAAAAVLSESISHAVAPLLPLLCIAMGIYISTHGMDNVCLARGKAKSLLRIQVFCALLFPGLLATAYFLHGGLASVLAARFSFELIRLSLVWGVALRK